MSSKLLDSGSKFNLWFIIPPASYSNSDITVYIGEIAAYNNMTPSISNITMIKIASGKRGEINCCASQFAKGI